MPMMNPLIAELAAVQKRRSMQFGESTDSETDSAVSSKRAQTDEEEEKEMSPERSKYLGVREGLLRAGFIRCDPSLIFDVECRLWL
jgi:hypothetical protein